MLFGKPFGEAHETFAEMFPEAADIIKKIKLRRESDNPSKKKHSNLAWMLQRIESTMFREIWMELSRQKIRFVSVHDSVIVEEHNHDRTHEIMVTVLDRHLERFNIK